MTQSRAGRAGFTLVETLVALVLFQVGMLALVGTAGVVARDLAEAVVRRRAQTLASARTEQLLAGACHGALGGSARLPNGMVEHWRIETVGVGRSVSDSIEAPLPRGRGVSVVARASTVCAR